jgi:hypothetical protein
MEKKKHQKITILINTTASDILPVWGAWDCIIKINGKEKHTKITILINTTASH